MSTAPPRLSTPWRRVRGSFVCMSGIIVLAAGCDQASTPTDPDPAAPANIAKLEVTPAGATLGAIGQTTQLEPQAFGPAGEPVTASNLQWTSSTPGVASVSGSGLVTAVSEGTAEIEVSAGTARAIATIVVSAAVARSGGLAEDGAVSRMASGTGSTQLTSALEEVNAAIAVGDVGTARSRAADALAAAEAALDNASPSQRVVITAIQLVLKSIDQSLRG